jgi:hypothetical protein
MQSVVFAGAKGGAAAIACVLSFLFPPMLVDSDDFFAIK